MSEEQTRCSETHRLLGQGAHLVDVRSEGEFAAGALSGAINVPLQSIQHAHGVLDKQTPMVVYCGTGRRSSQAKAYLHTLGYQRIHDLGGFQHIQRCAMALPEAG